ncbi:hypothetical protein RR46_00174 [Papilio xuthus]|uniref:Uncharacterized protein n=1 Tax=Papilio xuthus TaxID=66420 RepID=A0A0N1PFD6_PAPXU|nr:hypothetical protein RR46_00174 [Papilio xuthus]
MKIKDCIFPRIYNHILHLVLFIFNIIFTHVLFVKNSFILLGTRYITRIVPVYWHNISLTKMSTMGCSISVRPCCCCCIPCLCCDCGSPPPRNVVHHVVQAPPQPTIIVNQPPPPYR